MLLINKSLFINILILIITLKTKIIQFAREFELRRNATDGLKGHCFQRFSILQFIQQLNY